MATRRAPSRLAESPRKRRGPSTRKNSGKTVLTAAAVVLLAAAAILFYLVYGFSGVYYGVTSGGVALGGMNREEAVEALSTAVPDHDEGVLSVRIGDDYVMEIPSQEVTWTVDTEAAADAALSYGREGGFMTRAGAMLKALFFGHTLDAGTQSDTALLDFKLQTAADALNSGFVAWNCEVRLEEEVVLVTRGHPGLGFDRELVKEQILEKLRTGDFSELKVELTQQDAADVSAEELYERVYIEPQDARMTPDGLMAHVVGVSIDKEQAQALLDSTEGDTVTIPLILTMPAVLSDDLDTELFGDLLVKTHTKLTNPGLVNRTSNVKLAAEYVNGTVLNPGEVFSYNKVVGERTVERGFKSAQIFASGEIVDGLGGGICQVSSTLYMATLYADLEVVERRNHMFTVDYTKLGEDATVAYGSVDYKFRNDTNFPIRIDCWVDSPYVYVEIYGTRAEERVVTLESVITGQTGYETVEEEDPSLAPGTKKVDTYGHTGYTVDTYRVVKDADGNVIRRTFEATSRYSKLDKKVLVGPTASPSPSASVSPSPSAEPSAEPTEAPTTAPTVTPTETPTTPPTQAPTVAPTAEPTPVPTPEPTQPPVQTLPPTEPPAVG